MLRNTTLGGWNIAGNVVGPSRKGRKFQIFQQQFLTVHMILVGVVCMRGGGTFLDSPVVVHHTKNSF